MKVVLSWLLALFPFLHAQAYPVTVTSCASDAIVLNKDGVDFNASLFNIEMKDEQGWEKTCKRLQDGSSFHIEIDPSTQIKEPIPVYLFVDDTLLQELLLRDDVAYIKIDNPEYTYEKQMKDAQTTLQTMANSKTEITTHGSSYGWLFLGVLYFLWLVMLYRLYRKNPNIRIHKGRQKPKS